MDHDPPSNSPRLPSDEEIVESASQFVDLLRGMFNRFTQANSIGPNKAFELLTRAVEDPESLKRDLITEARKIDPAQTREGIDFISLFARSPRKALAPLLKDVFPPGTPGKRPQITSANEKQMVCMAQSLWPVVTTLVELREKSSKRTVKESIDYLSVDYPEATQILLKHNEVTSSFFEPPEQTQDNEPGHAS